MRPHLGGDIVDAESCGGRVRENAGDERAQLTTVMVRRVSLLGRGDDERADAAPGFDDAGALELGVDAATVLALMRRSTASWRTVGS